MKVRAHQYDTVDALCWRHYGRTQGVTEQVLQANPGLAEYGPFLPHGLQVELPDGRRLECSLHGQQTFTCPWQPEQAGAMAAVCAV